MKWEPLSVAVLAVMATTALAQLPPPERHPLTAQERKQGYTNHSLLAKPRAAAATGEIAAAERREGLVVRRAFTRFGNLRILAPTRGEAIEQTVARLRATGLYEYVEPDYLKQPRALPDDPRFAAGEQWHLRNTGQDGGVAGADLGTVAAWDVRTDASSVVVAVIDTGIRATHADLAANLWVNPGEIAGNGVDDDRNGYVDDVHGINSVVAAGAATSGDPEDDMGHGTAVAGALGAVGNNGEGVSGVAWRVKIMALKFDDAAGSATVSNEVECIDYALAKGARLINFSYGSNFYSQAEYDAIRRARDAGAVFITAAGNDALDLDSSGSFPGNYLLDNIVAVAATDRRDALWESSAHGEGLVELGAPGVAITTTAATGDTAYRTANGTSLSSPLVAGALALLQAQFPADNYRSLINRLLRGVDALPALAGRTQTGGRLNVAKLLTGATDRPFNDDFGGRGQLSGPSATCRAHSQGATAEAGEPAHAGLPAVRTLWWSWTAPMSGPAVVETAGSGVDTVIAVYTGGSLAALVSVASNDDASGRTTSRLGFTAQAGTTYQIAVGAKDATAGPVLLTVGFVPSNDDFASAIPLIGPSMRTTGFNTVAGGEPGEPKPDASATSRTVWYKWVAPASDYYSFSLFASGFDAVGAVYTGPSLASLTRLESTSVDNLNEAATFEATAGTTYYFQVDSADGYTGTFDLALVDAIALPGRYPANPSTAFSPATNYLVTADTYGFLLFINFDTTDLDYVEVDGTLEVHTPAVGADGAVFIGDEFGYFYAYNPDFTPRWKKDLGVTAVTSSPAIGADGTTYVHTDDGLLHAFHADGTVKWQARVPGESYSSPSIGADGTVYIGSTDHQLYALSPLDGSLRWTYLADGEIYSSPAIDAAGNLYFGTLNGVFYSLTSGGARRWSYGTGAAISSSPALGADGTIYFGCYDRHLYALNPGGTLRWRYATGDEIRASSPAIASDGTIYIGSYDGYLHGVTSAGFARRTYATGAYIRSSPLIHDQILYIGSGDNRVYLAYLGTDLADTPWPMHRQNIRRTGRRLAAGGPVIHSQTMGRPVAAGTATTLSVNAGGAEPLSFQWHFNGTPLAGATRPDLTIEAAAPASVGNYTVVVTNGQGSVTSASISVGLTTTAKVAGAGTEVGVDIRHPNGNTFDQVLLAGAAASITADPQQVTRMSYLDPNDDIVQVEFVGAGTLSLVLEAPTGPATPVKYNQPTVSYMKGRAGIVIVGADESTNVSVFSVGRATAFDPTGAYNILQAPSAANNPANNGSSLFQGHAATTYDGLADLAYLSITSRNGRFGGLRTANATYSATTGLTGVYAPGVAFSGPVFVGDIDARDAATPCLVTGSAADVRITGGDLLQANGRAVQVGGFTQLLFRDGSTSHGTLLPAQQNKARLEEAGIDVTSRVVVNP